MDAGGPRPNWQLSRSVYHTYLLIADQALCAVFRDVKMSEAEALPHELRVVVATAWVYVWLNALTPFLLPVRGSSYCLRQIAGSEAVVLNYLYDGLEGPEWPDPCLPLPMSPAILSTPLIFTHYGLWMWHNFPRPYHCFLGHLGLSSNVTTLIKLSLTTQSKVSPWFIFFTASITMWNDLIYSLA